MYKASKKFLVFICCLTNVIFSKCSKFKNDTVDSYKIKYTFLSKCKAIALSFLKPFQTT